MFLAACAVCNNGTFLPDFCKNDDKNKLYYLLPE
jgi:hypothetical protein